MQNDLAICCMSGGYKNAFSQGVLKAFEDNDVSAQAYASCSSSVLICAYAALKRMSDLDMNIWTDGFNISQLDGNSQSDAMLYSIDRLKQTVLENLWEASASRLLIATSYVNNEIAAAEVQSERSRRLGQKLLIDAARKNPSWRDENLELHLYDSYEDDKTYPLSKDNFAEVAYATTRMLHAWHIPAFIENKPYVDGSYTSLCPVEQVVKLGYKNVICILTEFNNHNSDFFIEKQIPAKIDDAQITFISPDCELKDLGVDFYKIEDNGLEKVFQHGYEKGLNYLQKPE